MRRKAAACFLAALAVAGCFAACRVFELGDVVSEPIEGGGGDASTDGSHEGGAADARIDADDAGCDASGDPCACLTRAVTLSTLLGGTSQAMAFANGHLYTIVVTAGGSPIVYDTPTDGLDGGPPPALTPGTSLVASTLVATRQYLFFRRTGKDDGILRLPFGAPVEAPQSYLSPLGADPIDLATDGAQIYWTNTIGAVCAASVDGAGAGDAGVLDSGPSGCGAAVVVPARDGGPAAAQLALNATTLFLSYNQKIYSAPLATGAVTPLVPVMQGLSVNGLTESQGQLFWAATSADAGALASANDDGTGARLIVPNAFEGMALQASFVVDADGIYWGARSYQKVWAAARDGSGVRLVACEPSAVAALASDATYVYWLTSNGVVKRATKR